MGLKLPQPCINLLLPNWNWKCEQSLPNYNVLLGVLSYYRLIMSLSVAAPVKPFLNTGLPPQGELFAGVVLNGIIIVRYSNCIGQILCYHVHSS